MSTHPPTLYIEGPAFWSPTLPGWAEARAAFRGEGGLSDPPAKRPAPQMLAAAERRRAPDTVALALDVAAQAIAASGRHAADLPCVFASAHGDLAINDYMCATLASDPKLLSPIKFHNSVHNAAVGYWTIGTGCHESSTSLAAFQRSFANGLLEAATLCAADRTAVLLVGYDVQAVGALASATASNGLLAVALVLAPEAGERSVAALDWSLETGTPTNEDASPIQPAASAAARSLGGNAMADALPFFEALATGERASLALPIADALSLAIRLAPIEEG